MFYFDVHTHHACSDSSLDVREVVQDVHSVGIHPWALASMSECEMEQIMNRVINRLERNENKQVVAIGECGIDKLCTASLSLQTEVFKRHVEWSEKYGFSLIIHCVKALDEMLYLKKTLSPTLPWIWHGFRGKPQQLEQLLHAGFYISFGYNYNKESLLACPLNRLFMETDDKQWIDKDKPLTIATVYEKVSHDLNISVEELSERCSIISEI